MPYGSLTKPACWRSIVNRSEAKTFTPPRQAGRGRGRAHVGTGYEPRSTPASGVGAKRDPHHPHRDLCKYQWNKRSGSQGVVALAAQLAIKNVDRTCVPSVLPWDEAFDRTGKTAAADCNFMAGMAVFSQRLHPAKRSGMHAIRRAARNNSPLRRGGRGGLGSTRKPTHRSPHLALPSQGRND